MKNIITLLTLFFLTVISVFAQVGINADNNTPAVCGQPFTDARDGKVYNTVSIGSQCWMAQNLNVGSRINGIGNQTNNGIIEKYCFDNNETNCNVYGGIYQWDECMNYTASSSSNPSGRQGICTTGWHIPSDAEWTVLSAFLGGESIAGGKLKETGTLHWANPNTGATNSSGFTGLPGGYRDINGPFIFSLGYIGYWWSSSEANTDSAWFRNVYFSISDLGRTFDNKGTGFSVRCLKDQSVPSTQTIQNISIPNGQTNCYNATQTITVAGGGTNFTVQNGGSVTIIAGESISYLPGTTVQSGGYMWGYIAPNGPYCVNPSIPIATATEDKIPVSSEQSSFKIFPNPTAGNFILELKGVIPANKVTVDVYGIWGEKMLSSELNEERSHEFSLSNRPAGVYLIRVITGDKSETSRIIKQ
jgi:uncharacterized protein (TIGR02145 family)